MSMSAVILNYKVTVILMNVFEYFSMNLAPGLILIAGVLQKIKKESPKQ